MCQQKKIDTYRDLIADLSGVLADVRAYRSHEHAEVRLDSLAERLDQAALKAYEGSAAVWQALESAQLCVQDAAAVLRHFQDIDDAMNVVTAHMVLGRHALTQAVSHAEATRWAA